MSSVFEWYKGLKDSSHFKITKSMLITFFEIKGTAVYLEFIPQGQTVNHAYYVEILKQLREVVRRKRPELWPNDISPAHKALSSSFWPKIYYRNGTPILFP
jgi:hypothetical protein